MIINKYFRKNLYMKNHLQEMKPIIILFPPKVKVTEMDGVNPAIEWCDSLGYFYLASFIRRGTIRVLI